VSRPEIAEHAAALRAERVPFVHATVVLADRPTSAKPGDEALVFGDGTIEGFVGGTCAESTVRAQSLTLLDSGEPLLLRISAEHEPGQEPEAEIGERTRERTGDPGRLSVHNPCLSGGTLEIFLEPVIPAPLLVVLGESPIAVALVSLGERLGYHVRPVAAPGGADATADPAGAAAVVCASHGRDEEDLLTAALAAGVPYVGLVASRKRGEAVVASLDVDEAARARVHTPCGLDIGARTPEEVALSVLAEIVAERRRTSGRPVAAHPAPHAHHHAGHDDHASHAGHEHHAGHGEDAPTGHAATLPERPGTAIDPVCGMAVAMVDASLHLDHDGQRYWFCGTGCLRAFAADPAGYLAT
jgi:xanthine dehydrogenase accessory factor